MRVLAVGNMYPPHHLGGYELVWRSAMEHLRAGGHEVTVLTTDHRQPGVSAGDDPGVRRELRWWWRDHEWPRFSLRARLATERHNAAVLDRALAEARPDVVAWWSMGGMSLSLIERVRRRGLPAVGFVHDDWMVYGPQVDAWLRLWRRPGSRLAAPVGQRATGVPTRVDLSRAALWLFVSEHTRRRAGEGRRLERTGVAHSGIDAAFLAPRPEQPWRWRLLYAGRLDARKGIATAVAALAQLPKEATLVIAGAGDERARAELRAAAAAAGVAGRMHLAGAMSRESLLAAYADTDAVLFPVVWDEPWGLVPLEAMGVGRPVVATGRGGSAEYLRDGENCLLAAPGDVGAWAVAIRRLADDTALRARLREGGAATAARHTAGDFDRRVEAALAEVSRS